MASRKKKQGGAHGNRARRSSDRTGEGEMEDGVASAQKSRRQLVLTIVFVLCLIAGGVALAVFRPWQASPEDTPAPWEYDEVFDRHWHPSHGHWHDGPPPGETRPAQTWTTFPAPWEYDPVNDQYWHPDHGHWHAGRPPPPEQR